MGALKKTRQELDATKLRLSSTQQSLHERDGHLNSLRHERRKQLEEILEMKLVSYLAICLYMQHFCLHIIYILSIYFNQPYLPIFPHSTDVTLFIYP